MEMVIKAIWLSTRDEREILEGTRQRRNGSESYGIVKLFEVWRKMLKDEFCDTSCMAVADSCGGYQLGVGAGRNGAGILDRINSKAARLEG